MVTDVTTRRQSQGDGGNGDDASMTEVLRHSRFLLALHFV
jgi:hypothetical protein